MSFEILVSSEISIECRGAGRNQRCPVCRACLLRLVHQMFTVTKSAPPKPPSTPVLGSRHPRHGFQKLCKQRPRGKKKANISQLIHSWKRFKP